MCWLLQGYVKRQAVFACNTCTPSSAEPAGICLACANECHDGHDIFELYTKRYFEILYITYITDFVSWDCSNISPLPVEIFAVIVEIKNLGILSASSIQ